MSIWQTEPWQHMLQKSEQVEAFFEIDGFFVEKRKISLGECGMFIVGVDQEIPTHTHVKLLDLCKKHKCLFLQIETLDYEHYPQETSVSYKRFIPRYTCVIDLTRSEADILADMKQKGRYNIRLAEKKGVVVEQVEKSVQNIETFYSLMTETTHRGKFKWNVHMFYQIFLHSIENSELMFAYLDGKVIAAGVFVYTEDVALYYYGASSNEYREVMAPYLLQWEAIKRAKKRKCQMYDFLGIASPDGKDREMSLAGVTEFKKKFTQDIRHVSKSYIFINKPLKYRLITGLRFIKSCVG